jgi:hypothetical protein
MKKFLSVVLLLTVLVLSLFGCSSTPQHFKGKWNFSQITSVEFSSDVTPDTLDMLKESYGVNTEEEVLNSALAKFRADGTFNTYYLKFDTKYTYTYDALLERETTWVFYQMGENEGFISYDANLDASAGNPAPEIFPEISYKADTNTMSIVERYGSFLVTLELKR